jgi:hypothetical protein
MSTKKKSKFGKIEKNKKASGEYLYYFFHVALALLYTITSSWCSRFDSPCILTDKNVTSRRFAL